MEGEIAQHLLPEVALAGAILAAAGAAFTPITVMLARRIFPWRRLVFAHWGYSHLFLAVLAYFGLMIVAARLLVLAFGDEPGLLPLLVATALVQGGVSAAVAYWAWKRDPDGLRCLGLWSGRQWRALAAGVVAYLLSLPAIFGLGLLWPWLVTRLGETYRPQLEDLDFLALAGRDLWIATVLAVLVIPLFEELLFRSFLQPLLVQSFREKGGIVLTAAVFALFHGASAFLPIFGLALLLGAVMLRTQRLLAVWGIHALHNGLQIGLILLGSSLSEGAVLF